MADSWLIRGDVRVVADVDECAVLVEHGNHQIATDAIGVVDVEDRRPGAAGSVHTRERLDLLVIQSEGVPVDVIRIGDGARHADGVAVGLQQVADILRRAKRAVVVGCVFARLAEEVGIPWQPLHVDAHRRVAYVRVADCGAGLVVALGEPKAQLVAATARTQRRIGQLREVIGRRRRVGEGRLAADADEVLVQCAQGARQDHSHAGILRIDRVVVTATPGGFRKILAYASVRGGQLAGVGASAHVPTGVEQLDNHVERVARLVDVDPHFRSGVAPERIEVDIRRIIPGDEAMRLEAESPILVAALLLSRLPRVCSGGKVGAEHTEDLCRVEPVVDTRPVAIDSEVGPLSLDDDRYVAVVGILQELKTTPVAGAALGQPVVSGIGDVASENVGARADRVIEDRREHDGEARLPDHLHRASDAVVDVESVASRREPRIGAVEFHDQARVRSAHEPQTGGDVEILDEDLVAQHVHDIHIVPYALDGDLLAPHDHTGGRLDARRVGDTVAANERPEVIFETGVGAICLWVDRKRSGTATDI